MKKSCTGMAVPSQDCVKKSLWKVYLNSLQIGYHYDEQSAEEQAALYIEKGCNVERESFSYQNGYTIHSIYLNDQDEQQ